MRRLALISGGYCAAVLLAQYLLAAALRPWAALGLFCLGLLSLLLSGERRQRALLLLFSASVGMLWSWGHYMLLLEPGNKLGSQTVTAEVKVTSYVSDLGGYQLVYAEISGTELPEVKTALYSYDCLLPEELAPGDSFSASLYISSAARRRGEETDIYSSRGIYLIAYLNSEPEGLRTGREAKYFPQYAAHALSEAVGNCFPEDVSPFFRALLTGDRVSFNSDRELKNSFSYSGLSHVVSVSGMHVAFLLGFVGLFTARKRLLAAVGIPLVIFFALMTGGGAPVVRAAVMQVFILAAPLFKRENDPVTSFSAALLLLLVINPASCASASLQLSFAAIAGLMAVSQRCYRWLSERPLAEKLCSGAVGRLVFQTAAGSVSSSVGATLFTLPLIALHFGSVSLYGLITNLLCLWAVELAFCLGFAATLLFFVFPSPARLLALVPSVLARGVFAVVRVIGKLPFSAVFTIDGAVTAWLIVSYALLALLWLLRRKTGFRPILPLCLSAVMLCCVLMTQAVGDRFAVLDTGQGACSVLSFGDTAVVIDCGRTLKSGNAGDRCADYLISQGQRDIDLLALTHLHRDHANGVAELFSRMEIKLLALPKDADDSDGLLDEILACAEKQGTEVIYVWDETDFTLGEVAIRARVFADGTDGSDSNERGCVYLLAAGEFDALVTGDAGTAVEAEAAQAFSGVTLDLLVAGHHGSAGSSGGVMLSALRPKTAVISVGAGNSYGHPAEAAVNRLLGWCESVYRTDLSGDIVFRLG